MVLLCLIAGGASAQTRVVDGDTLDVGGVRIRLADIDAPEHGQRCQSKAGLWSCGDAATKALSALIAGTSISCQPGSKDGYGRLVTTCYADGVNIAEMMVVGGHAWAFVKYADTYVAQETAAKAKGLGIWRAPTETAWDFRARRWQSAQQVAPSGCPIKGNISSNGRIYHPPWSPWYSRTRINTAKGERWFCNEAEAKAAGWRAPRWR